MKHYWSRKLKRRLGWLIKTNPVTKRLLQKHLRRKNAGNYGSVLDLIETADKVEVGECSLRMGIVKDEDDLALIFYPYWPMFERFARNNGIKYSFFNIHGNNWIEESKNFDLIVWRPFSDPSSLYEERTKIAYLERYLKIRCHPSCDELWIYEDKIRQHFLLSGYNLPVIPTFVSFDETECLNKLDSLEFPVVSKSYVGSSSYGVTILKSKKKAQNHISRAFSKGLDTGFPYFRQKGYVYFQKFIRDASYDLRIILIGSKIFGYYRMTPSNDFRASGAGLVVKEELPLEAVKLAMKVREVMPGTMLAVDFLKSESENKFYINETSINIDIETPDQLMVNNSPGYYLLKDDKLEFHHGKFWLQELILAEIISGRKEISESGRHMS